MSPDGKRLYVITQCGAGLDPVFVVDTATDKVVDSISGLAVGLSGVITPNGKKLYTGQTIEIPAQISVITTADLRVVTDVPLNAFALATTHDGGHLLVGGEKRLDIVDTKTDEIINTIPLGTSPAGLTATEDQRIFVWLPAENRLFLTGLGGLVPSRKSKQ